MKKIYLSVFYIICSLFIFTTPAAAKVIMQEKGTVIVGKSEVIEDDLFIGAESVVIEGVVKGDVYVGTGSLTVNGQITGDLVTGTGNLILAGAKIGDSLIAGAGQIDIDDKSTIGGSLIAGTGNLRSSATVGRNVMVGAGTVYLNNKIGKETRIGAGSLELGPKANLVGDLSYALGEDSSEITLSETSTISGGVIRYTPPPQMRQDIEKARRDARELGRVASKGWLIISFLGSLVVGFLLIKLFPHTARGLSTQISEKLMGNLGVGFLIAIAAFPTLLILALTIIGLPLAGLLLLVLFVDLHLAKLASSYALGHFIAKQFSWNKMGSYAVFFVGLVVFYLLRAVPGLGWITSLLFTWVGLGAIWLYTSANLKKL